MLFPSCLAFVQLAVDRDRRQKLLMGADSGLSAIHKDDLLHLREVVQAVRDEEDDLIPGIFLQVGKDRILRVPIEG